MAELRVLDANVILRFLLADHPDQSPRCRVLFTRLEAGKEAVFLPEIVVADVVWTLTSFYRWPKEKTRGFLDRLLALRGLRTVDTALLSHSLQLFAERNIDFTDALVAAEMVAAGRSEIYSFDEHFNRISQITRIEP
jgi:predicted nucleic acid-binding protein